MDREKLELLEFAARIRDRQKRPARLTDRELLERIRRACGEWFPVDSETLILIEELIERFEKGTKEDGKTQNNSG